MVVNLGTNDFSTAINPGEPWTPDSLAAAYRTAYGDSAHDDRLISDRLTSFITGLSMGW